MNDSDLISALVGKSPKDWIHDGATIALLIMAAGRAWHAIRNGGGIVGTWRALLYGTNAPKSENEGKKTEP